MTEDTATAGANPAEAPNEPGETGMPETAPELSGTREREPGSATAGTGEPLVADLARQNTELRDRHLRLQAEFENFRKRKMRESEEVRAYAAASVLSDVLPVLDHLDLALTPTLDRTDASWGKGIDLIARQLADSLRNNGLEEIPAAEGDKFDPAWHEAVAEEAVHGVAAGSIVRILRKGYRLRERLLRAAQVVVAKPGEEPSSGSVPAGER